MSKKIRKKFKKYIINFFDSLERHHLYLRVINWPRSIRLMLSVFLGIFGLVAFLTPIPGGSILMVSAIIIIWGISPVRETSIRLLLRFKIYKLKKKFSFFSRFK